MREYTPEKRNQVNLSNLHNRSNSNLKNKEYEFKPHTNVMYKGKDRSARRNSSPDNRNPPM